MRFFGPMPFRAIGTRLRNWRKWRLYILVITLAYILTLVFGTLLAPMRGNLENLVFDQYQRWSPRPYAFDQPVRIVDIDDESIARIGRWPWPRAMMASLVDALAKANVAAIGFDVLFSEKDQPSEDLKACASATARSADQAAHCEERADGDVAFANAISGRPVVLGTFFTTTPNAAKTKLVPKGGFSFVGETPTSLLTHLNGVLAPIPVLAQAASGLGFLNWLPDDDRVVRRVPLLLEINGQIQPSLAMETLRVAQGASSYVVKSANAYGENSGATNQVEAIKMGDIVVPTQAAGDLRVWFAKSDPRRSSPAWKVLEPGADLSDLAGKLVFVGASASLLADIVATPLNPSTPGVEAHAQLVEQILSGVTLIRPDWAPYARWISSGTGRANSSLPCQGCSGEATSTFSTRPIRARIAAAERSSAATVSSLATTTTDGQGRSAPIPTSRRYPRRVAANESQRSYASSRPASSAPSWTGVSRRSNTLSGASR